MVEKRKLSAVIKKHQHHLTAGERQAMPKSDFALPGKGDGPKGAGSGSYPIPDKAHARAALSRASANATPAEKETIERKVHEKFPGIGSGAGRASKLYRPKTVGRA